MNELIKNLAVEADLAQIYNGTKYPHLVGKFSPSLSGPTEKQLEKFAESIVRECINLLPDECQCDESKIHASWKIKQYFGVE
jgi:hypothetical protein